MSPIIQQALALADNSSARKLGLSYGGKQLTPEEHISRDEAKNAPTLTLANSGSSSKEAYTAITVDLDVPYESMPLLGPLVHWIQPGLTANEAGVLSAQDPSIVDWLQPSPPPLSGPHRYVFILYKQPEGFEAGKFALEYSKPVGMMQRARWDLDEFVKEAGLETLVGCDYFHCN